MECILRKTHGSVCTVRFTGASIPISDGDCALLGTDRKIPRPVLHCVANVRCVTLLRTVKSAWPVLLTKTRAHLPTVPRSGISSLRGCRSHGCRATYSVPPPIIRFTAPSLGNAPTANLRDISARNQLPTVRLVFRPYTHVTRSICTSEPLRASTGVSAGFTQPTDRSPPFGYHISN